MTQYVAERVEKLENPMTAWVLLGIIVSLVFVYAAFIDATISNIVATKDMQTKVSALTTSVSNLESAYLASKSSITMDVAMADGFVQETKDPVFISKDGGALTFNQ